jgi:hypothetical protein
MDVVTALNRVAQRVERLALCRAEQIVNEREQLLGYLAALLDLGLIEWAEWSDLSQMVYEASKRCGHLIGTADQYKGEGAQ